MLKYALQFHKISLRFVYMCASNSEKQKLVY